MNHRSTVPLAPLATEETREQPNPSHGPRLWRQVTIITVAALGLFIGIRLLPTGTNLSHMDFRAQAGNSIEFCDPLNPQFIPVVAVRSPVSMALNATPPKAGEVALLTLTLTTSTGKRIGPADLLVSHTKKLHLLVVDPSLSDYQHLHPEPGKVPGEWNAHFTPRHGGLYRIFADFTPAATGVGLYAGADLAVAGVESARDTGVDRYATYGTYEANGMLFKLTPLEPIRVRQPAELTLSVERSDGGSFTLEPIMGAFAHLVAFDEPRSGFAHLHPSETDLAKPPEASHPRLSFKVSIPRSGLYVIWAQTKIADREVFAPFWFEVRE